MISFSKMEIPSYTKINLANIQIDNVYSINYVIFKINECLPTLNGDIMSNQFKATLFRIFAFNFIAVITLLFSGCAAVTPLVLDPRPMSWATLVTHKPGLQNLYRVNSNLYRSAQPTAEGFVFLNSKPQLLTGDSPIQTIISLRALHDDEQLLPSNNTLRFEQIRFNTWHPEDEDIIKFLRIANTKTLHPVLVHCQYGSDRTGTMVAIYRIAYEGWTKQQAIDEMIRGGYGFHSMWQNLRYYIEQLDIDALKTKVATQGAWHH
jgi:Tyrosine phosphatase family